MTPTDRRGGGDRSQASAVASPRDGTARQRRHGTDPAATPGRVAALKRPRWSWVTSGKPEEFWTGDLS